MTLGVTFTADKITTQGIQNVSGSDGNVGFFFLNGWFTHPGTNIELVRPGWVVAGHPTWIVTAVDPNSETVTISGGTFISGASYAFTGHIGVTVSSGVTFDEGDGQYLTTEDGELLLTEDGEFIITEF
jgi:hypothetical protein